MEVDLLQPETPVGAVQVARRVAPHAPPQDEVLCTCRRLDWVRLDEGYSLKGTGQGGRAPSAAEKARNLSSGTVVEYVFSKRRSVLSCGHCHATAGSDTSVGERILWRWPMPSFVALLRAVNVGGTGKLPMRDLEAMCREAGLADVRT